MKRRHWRVIQYFVLVMVFASIANAYLSWSSPAYRHSSWEWILLGIPSLCFCHGVLEWQKQQDAKAQADKIDKLDG